MKKFTFSLTLMLMTSFVFSQKAIETTATITDITVYTAAAEIHYEKTVSLEKGKNTVIFTGLTTEIVPNTINIGSDDPSVSIVTVTDKLNYIKSKKTHTELVKEYQDSITAIADRSGLIGVKIEALEAEKGLLFHNGAIGGVEDGVAVSEIEKASNFFQKRYYDIALELYNLKRQRQEMAIRTEKLQRQIKQNTTTVEKTTSEIMMIVNSPSRKKVTFNFKLLTDQGGWSPVYDFKFAGTEKPLEFIFRANVFNSCGIPWNDVNLKLSTANPIRGFQVPTLNSHLNARKPSNINRHGQEVKFQDIQVSNVIAEYEIKHKYSIPSDASPYLVEVDGYEMPSGFSYLMIPKLDPFGFLMAEIPNWNKYNLIPGTTNIYNNGTYMGKTFLQTYAPNDTLSVYLGKDQGIQANRQEKNIHHPRNIMGNYAIDKTIIDISIKNNTSSSLKIRVLDHVPVVNTNDKVKLNIMEISNANHDEKDGMLYWNYTLTPGQSEEITIKYELKAPKEYRDHLKSKARYYRTISSPSFR